MTPDILQETTTGATMLETITAFIEQHALLPASGTVVVAVSGGADSLCLLHLLHRLCGPAKRYPHVQLHVAHLNHLLRPEVSTQEAATVAAIAQAWGLPITVGVTDVPALAHQEQRSLEDAARTARYRFLRDVARNVQSQGTAMGTAPIAVAHHRDDQVETLILHWLRGGGITSMIGLQPRTQDIIRPLLSVTHADTVAYCQQHQLTPIEDASNQDIRFQRNRIRHELLPLLEAMNPGFRATLLRNAEVLSVDAAWIEQQLDIAWPAVVISSTSNPPTMQLTLDALLALPLSLQRHLLRRITSMLCDGQSPLELRHYHLIEQLLQRPTSQKSISLDLPAHLHITRTPTTLTLARTVGARFIAPSPSLAPSSHTTPPSLAPTSDPPLQQTAMLTIPGQVLVPGTPWRATAAYVPDEQRQQMQQADPALLLHILNATRYAVYIDAENCADQLLVRTRRAGDRIRPLGMAHEKKIQDILVDRHIARAERDSIPLFFSRETCIWLAGICLSDAVRITDSTQRIIRLAIEPSQGPHYTN